MHFEIYCGSSFSIIVTSAYNARDDARQSECFYKQVVGTLTVVTNKYRRGKVDLVYKLF